ncbi:hypothetical protein SH580_05920 [Coraliomargarita algicola]|uniref:Uncharacterized protein n=1 Tax=Coraliomargarita algicola TaxID=3092156 RepID=A0ABZ0RQ14_9BACT|nr:hypothetical protein [Coraliomargarita sp. J2-16]WPJ97243.1 hypothetical protein SH580_05920 [Coraliomargarita sp. J2-16]
MTHHTQSNPHSTHTPNQQKQQLRGIKLRSLLKQSTAGLIALSIGILTPIASQAQEILLDEDFSRSAKGTFLEHSSESEWHADKGRLIIGNGRALNGQALGYAPNRTWANQTYYKNLNATLAPGEAVEVSFSAAVKTDASPEFYIYAMRLNDGDNSIQIQVKGGKDAPVVTIESVLNNKKTQAEITSASYYETSESAGLVAVAMLVTENSAQAYYDRNGKGEWIAIGEPVACQLSTLDRVQLKYYSMGFWSAMDDLKVAIGKPGQ